MITAQAAAALLLGTVMTYESWGYVMPQLDPTDTLLLVNKQNKAPIVPMALVLPEVDPVNEKIAKNVYMRPEAAAALTEMYREAEREGIKLYALSGYRSYATQKAIFQKKAQERGAESANRSSAKAGYSEHQTGLAMDFEGESLLGRGLVAEIGESPEGKWVAENCWKYGFILRYQKGKTPITGYIYEPWHVRYVGREVAREVYDLDITYEEYMKILRARRLDALEAEDEQ